MLTPRKQGTPRRKSARLSGLPPRLTPRKTTPRKTPRKTPVENTEPIQNEQGGEEGITVAIRMRPLNTKESNANRVWRVLPQYHSITQTTNTGQPLPERVTGRTFFTFDKTFGEDAETINVYDSVAKGIVESVVSGLNGTIFAYGQTSSGKTYTMQGSGSIEEGYTNGGGGIVHMAANDIFTHVQNTPDRIFLIRASFIEIYNEEVRDLLGENAVLAVREDPRRGVFVSAVEEIVTDFESLLCILFAGEKNRAVAATGMNERSSRSHTIFRVTIESRNKTEESDENDMDASNSSLPIDDDGAVLISTLNLVDLAGSESVRHTGSTGERQKEGGKINQSLLTLSRVIVGLGQPNQAHINFRDSKLTRILQPSLSGNARMAVICCATPSELYLEETRSTLLFASRAKLVKTRAQVNEVLDDRSLIKRLQRELAEARQQGQGHGQMEHLKALETEASNAGAAARDAEKKLNKLKSSILNHAVVFKGSRSEASNASKKRRLSDGNIAVGSTQLATPPKGFDTASSPKSVPQAQKRPKTIEQRGELPVSFELEIIKEAHNAKVKQTKKLEERVGETEKKVFDAESSLSRAVQTISELRAEKEEAVEESRHLSSEISSLFTEMQAATLRYESAIAAKDATISEWVNKLKMEQASKQSLEESTNALMEEFERLKDDLRTTEEQAMADSLKAAEEKSHLEHTIRLLSSEKSTLVEKLEQRESEQVESNLEITELKTETQQLQSRIDSLSEERVRSAFEVAQVNSDRESLAQEKETHQQQIKGMSAELSLLKATMGDMVEEKAILATKLNNANQAVSELTMEKQELVQQVTELKETINHRDSSIESLEERMHEIEKSADALTTNISLTESKLEQATSQVASLTSELETKTETITNLEKALHDAGEKYDNDLMQTKKLLENVTVERDELKADVSTLNSVNSSNEEERTQLRSKLVAEEHHIEKLSDELKCMTTRLEFERKENEKLTSLLESDTAERDGALTRLESITKDFEVAENTIETLKESIVELESVHDILKSQLEATLAEKCSTEEKVTNLEASMGETGTHLAEALAHIDTLQAEKQGWSEDVAAREAIHISKLEELHDTQTSLEEAQEQVASFKSAIAEMESDREALKCQLEALSQDKCSIEEKVANLETAASETETRLAEAVAHIDRLQAEKQGLSEDVAAREAVYVIKLEELQNTETSLEEALEQIASFKSAIAELESDREALQSQFDALSHDKCSIKEKVANLETSSGETKTRLAEALAHIDTLQAEKQGLSEDVAAREAVYVSKLEKLQNTETSLEEALEQIASFKSAIAEMESDRKALKSQLEAVVDDKCSIEKKVANLETSAGEKETRLAEALASVDTLQVEKQGLSEDVAAREAIHISKLEELHDTETSLEEALEQVASFKSAIAELESDREALKSQLEALSQDKCSIEEKVANLETSAGETETRLAEALAHIDTLQAEKQELSEDVAAREAVHVSKLEELHDTRTSLEEALEQVALLKSDIAEMESDRKALKSQLEAVVDDKCSIEEKVAKIETSTGETETRLAEALAHIDTLQAEKQGLSEDVAAREAVYVFKLEELQNTETSLEEALEHIASFKSAIAELESDREALQSQFDALSHDKCSTEEKIANLETSASETETRLAEALAHIDTLQAEKQGLSEDVAAREAVYVSKLEKLQNTETSLEEALEQIASFKSAIAELESDREALKSQLKSVDDDLNKTKEQVANFGESKDEAESRLAECRAQVAMLQAEKHIMSVNISELHGMQVLLKEAYAQIETLKATIAESELQTSEKDLEAMKLKLQEAEADANELKQLLAAANDSVNEAREAALAAEDELQDKEKSLEESLQRLFQSEEELRVATDELSRLEGRVSSSADDAHKEQVKVLLLQIAAAEAQLDSERRERMIAEEELRRIMAEEQRTLVQEAEEKLASLKKEILNMMSSRSSAEAEAYALRQEMEDLQDQNKRLETKALEADLLHQSEKRLKDQVSALSEARLVLQSELARAEQELASQSKHSDREVVEATAELSRVKSDCYAAQQESIDLKEDVKRLVKENSSSTREVRLLREKSANLEAAVLKLEDENHELMSRLRKLELAKIQEQKNAHSLAEIKNLQSRITELESSIKSKDSRIKKLEAVKLTKEKCQAIERIKEERTQFSIAAEDYRAKLVTAEATISHLQAKVARVSRNVGSTPDGDEMASMKFAKDALETKLRKYAAHCQRLENEKASVLDALKAVNGSDIDDGEVTRAVIALCDKHTSLEEECEALMSAEKRASSYLSELDHLREMNSSLQKSFSDAESKLAMLTNSEADLVRKLNEAKDKVALLRKERDHLKVLAESERGNIADLESEKSRQVRYLEQENLQLMLDLKNAKKEIKATRAQLDAMRMTVVDDETEDFGNIAAHNLDVPRANGGDKARKSPDSSDSLSPLDKENRHENATGRGSEKTHGTESSRKRRFASVNRSAKKMRNTASRTLGLGEAGSVHEDQAGECKQS